MAAIAVWDQLGSLRGVIQQCGLKDPATPGLAREGLGQTSKSTRDT